MRTVFTRSPITVAFDLSVDRRNVACERVCDLSSRTAETQAMSNRDPITFRKITFRANDNINDRRVVQSFAMRGWGRTAEPPTLTSLTVHANTTTRFRIR